MRMREDFGGNVTVETEKNAGGSPLRRQKRRFGRDDASFGMMSGVKA
jgi:hypothetical protein